MAAVAGRAAGAASARGWGEGDEVGSDVEEESDGEGEEDQERRQRRQQEEEEGVRPPPLGDPTVSDDAPRVRSLPCNGQISSSAE